jgi:peptidyl-prolyl cis-trans isomerase D
MFDFVRKHTKIMQFVLFLLIFPSFVLVGLDQYGSFNKKGEAVAKVAGQEIGQAEWDAAHKQEVERLRTSMPTVDPKLLDSPEARYATLERLVRDRILAVAADKLKLGTSDARLARDLQENPTIASLRSPDGRLDMDRYRQLAASQGLTPEMFEAQVRADISSRQVLSGVVSSALVVPQQAQLALDVFFQRREIQVARFMSSDYANKVTLSDADLESYYKRNEALFQAPEQASIEFLVLDVEGLKKTVVVNEQDLKGYFEQNAARLGSREERRASHILVAAPKAAPEGERQKARARAEELLAAVRKAPDSFGELARKHSQDPGSAAKGGDLDFFARGAMVKPFEDVAFGLNKGDISQLVETEYGFHIIRLTDIKAPQARSFADMRPELEAELRKQQAQRKFAEVADAFTNGVYEQPDSLKPIAERLKLEIQTASNVTRVPSPGASGVLSNAKFLAAVFSTDAVDKKRNTEAVEIATGQLASGRIVQYTPARTKPFAEVKDSVRARLLAERAAELARKEGSAQLSVWKAQPAKADLPGAIVVSRDQLAGQPSALVEAVLRADLGQAPAWVGVDLGAQGYAVAKVNKALPRIPPAAEALAQEHKQFAQLLASAEGYAYYAALKERFKAQILVPRPIRDANGPGSSAGKS